MAVCEFRPCSSCEFSCTDPVCSVNCDQLLSCLCPRLSRGCNTSNEIQLSCSRDGSDITAHVEVWLWRSRRNKRQKERREDHKRKVSSQEKHLRVDQAYVPKTRASEPLGRLRLANSHAPVLFASWVWSYLTKWREVLAAQAGSSLNEARG